VCAVKEEAHECSVYRDRTLDSEADDKRQDYLHNRLGFDSSRLMWLECLRLE
jgi:hypothetical protein